MARLTLVATKVKNGENLAHRASASEGEAARRLLESQGFTVKGPHQKQYTLRCPFHEGPGVLEPRKSPNFYINSESSMYMCQSAACGEKGNLRELEKFFGIDQDDDYVSAFRDRESRLKEYELNLTEPLRTPFRDHGLTDATIARFRLGYEPEHETETGQKIPGRYVIPYLEGRRPKFFRYYSPNGDPKFKYTWEEGASATLFNASDAVGDKDGVVYLCEGEQKAMMLCQLGYAAIAVPGASQWKDEYSTALSHAKKIIVCYDNDNTAHHVYDKPERSCTKCGNRGFAHCIGHNPGQDAALKRVEQIGWRAKNMLLPAAESDDMCKTHNLPGYCKTDINDYFIRDGRSNADFAELATGKRITPFKVQSLADIMANPPDEAEFLIEDGILSVGGRLLVAGKPKVGKSLFINNLALSLASGLPFLRGGKFKGFAVDHPTRTLLLDRELSKHSLFKRLSTFTDSVPAFQAAHENLLIDHDHLIRLDQPNAYDTMLQLIEQNGAEVCILDTAYKFFGGDVESSTSVKKAFSVLDELIHQTGCAFVLTHHLKKSQGSNNGKQAMDVADPDSVVGSFLWTGWPNGTVLLNFLNRSVEDPFNSVATFTAFRDAAAPEPVTLYRDRSSITYTAVEKYEAPDDYGTKPQVIKPSTDAVQNLLLDSCPTTEEDFLHMAAGHFGVGVPTVKPYFIDAMTSGYFERTSGRPPIIKFKDDKEVDPADTWEADHGLPPKPMPANIGAGLTGSIGGGPDTTKPFEFNKDTGEIL